MTRKLGIRDGHSVHLAGAPEGLDLDGVGACLGGPPWNVVVAFVHTREALQEALDFRHQLVADGGLWIAWPKKASKVPTELNRELVRAVGLSTGLVDNKVCAIDEVYSALRFVVRLVDRPG